MEVEWALPIAVVVDGETAYIFIDKTDTLLTATYSLNGNNLEVMLLEFSNGEDEYVMETYGLASIPSVLKLDVGQDGELFFVDFNAYQYSARIFFLGKPAID